MFAAIILYSFATLFLYADGTEEILGCGGFVKSEVPIDFSNIEVRQLIK